MNGTGVEKGVLWKILLSKFLVYILLNFLECPEMVHLLWLSSLAGRLRLFPVFWFCFRCVLSRISEKWASSLQCLEKVFICSCPTWLIIVLWKSSRPLLRRFMRISPPLRLEDCKRVRRSSSVSIDKSLSHRDARPQKCRLCAHCHLFGVTIHYIWWCWCGHSVVRRRSVSVRSYLCGSRRRSIRVDPWWERPDARRFGRSVYYCSAYNGSVLSDSTSFVLFVFWNQYTHLCVRYHRYDCFFWRRLKREL